MDLNKFMVRIFFWIEKNKNYFVFIPSYGLKGLKEILKNFNWLKWD